MGSGLNLLTSLLHPRIFGFSGQKRGSPDHNSKLIVDGMKNLLRKGHSNPRQRKWRQTLVKSSRFSMSALNCGLEPVKIQGKFVFVLKTKRHGSAPLYFVHEAEVRK